MTQNESRSIKYVNPENIGWLETKLTKEEMDYLWGCIKDRKESVKTSLAGNITESNNLVDEDNWFFRHVLAPLCGAYASIYNNLGSAVPTELSHPYSLHTFWVNYQNQNEFNPLHYHPGVYSFVIWMKIPTRYEEQNKNPIAANCHSPRISAFNFQYVNILGELRSYIYEMNPEMEGTLLFFPSGLNHIVYPFMNCSEERISISGNIGIDTTKILHET